MLFATHGMGASTIGEFKKDFVSHGGKPTKIQTFSCDMSQAFLSGVAEHLPKAQVVLDKFHLVKMLSEAVDATRRSESRSSKDMKGTRYLWLKNPDALSNDQSNLLSELTARKSLTKTAEAHHLKISFQEMFKLPARFAFEFFNQLLDAAFESGVKAIEQVA